MRDIMIRRQFLNAILIKFRNLMDSIAVKLCLCITLIASLIFSFWPVINSTFVEKSEVKIYSNTNLDFSGLDSIKVTDSSECDVEILVDSQRYTVIVHNDKFNDIQNEILGTIYKRNLQEFTTANSQVLTEEQLSKIENSNISIEYDKNIKEVNNELSTKLMIVIMIILIMVIILVSRVGARVAYDKGNQITEVILTSISRNKLFSAEIISNMLVVWVNILAMVVPIAIAYFVDNKDIAMDFSFLTFPMAIEVFIHLSFCILGYLVLVIGLCSLSKRPDDSNAATIVMMIPLYISFYYSIMNLHLFDGMLVFMNYIPLFSIFTLLSSILNAQSGVGSISVFFLFDIIFLLLEIIYVRKIYYKNISKI